jgi:hypothetical protein
MSLIRRRWAAAVGYQKTQSWPGNLESRWRGRGTGKAYTGRRVAGADGARCWPETR